MKTLRLIVSMRLAFFPLVFNLSIAQEVEVITENIEQISPTPQTSPKSSPDREDLQDFQSFQEGQESSEIEEENDSLIKEENVYHVSMDEVVGEVYTQDSQLFTQLDGAEQDSLNPEGEKIKSFGTSDNEVKNLEGEIDRQDTQDSSLHSEGQTGSQEILSPSDSLFQKGAQEVNTQDSSLNAQNDKSPLQSEGQENLDLPNLIISEVYRLGTTERIEITNLSDKDFSGKLRLSGAKSSLYSKNLDIPSYTSIILADKAEIGLINDENLVVDNAGFNIIDSDEISISLIYAGNEIDTFVVDKSVVSNNQIPTSKPRPTFQKIYNNGREIQVTAQSDLYNITGNFIANPGKIIIENGNPWIGNGPTNSPYNSDDSGTGNNSGDGNDSGAGAGNSEGTGDSNIPGSGDISGTGNDSLTGDIMGENSDFNLILSEVFYDDDDEWIEIFNIGNGDFFGDLTLSGDIFSDNKIHTYQNIKIPANDFLIIADSNEMFDFSSTNDGNVNILLNEGNYPQFSISDTDEIQISLFLSGQKIDSFYAHKYRVSKRDDYGVSFHKILTQDGPIITWSISNDDANLSEDTYNSANPGVLYTYADEIIDYGISPENSPQEENSDIIDCSNVADDIITISEIFRGGSRYDPFVEFSIHDDIMYDYDSLLLSGSLLTQPIIIDLDRETESYDREKLQKNTRLILTTKAGDLAEAGLITIVYHSDLNFNYFSGELELYGIDGQSRQVLDIVKITTGLLEKSNYHIGYAHSCGDNMDNIDNFSPGFDESALKYFSTTSKYNEKIVEKIKYVGGGGGCSCPSKAELCGTVQGNVVETGNNTESSGTEGNGSEGSYVGNEQDTQDSSFHSEGQIGGDEPHPDPLQTPSKSSPDRDDLGDFQSLGEGNSDEIGEGEVDVQIKIVSLEPKTPESITLQSFLPYDIDFKNHNYYLKTSTSTTKKYIDGILYANTIDTFTKSFGFVDAGACVYLYSGDSKLDSYCYSSEKIEKEPKEEQSGNFYPSDYQLSITHINYDPEGSDSGNETITIKSASSNSLDLSKIKMKVNSTNKKLTGILEPYSSITLKGNFGFPNSTKDNSDVVVTLFYDNYIFSTYTYNPNKPKVEIPDGAVKVYSVIDGDTFRYRKEDGSLQSVRLLGVDAPESNTARYRTTECFGKEAKNYLTNLLKNQYVTLEFDQNSAQSDAYGRILAYVYIDGKLVNETLIAEGYAKEYTYKTPYMYQSAFKQAEENAKRSEKGLRSSAICGKSIEEEPEAWGIDYEKLSIKILSVDYDPDGTDSGNETVQLSVDNSQISAVSSIDFSDDFSLTIFPRSEYATGTTKTKKLTEFGLLDISNIGEITLKGNFGLPNNRATCISLNQGSYTFDTLCYNPNDLLSDEELIFSGQVLTHIPDVKIQSIIPNPSGTDSEKEEITLLRTPSQDFPESLNLLDLSPDFSLLINGKTKKKLAGNLIPNQKITIKGSFGFPNSASCVSLLYKGEELDNFCYSKASDGVKFNSDNTLVHEIPTEELAIVKKITLVKQGDKLCISYNKILFSCKSIPNSTTEKNKKQLSMQNTFILELEKYLRSNYSTIYYDSKVKEYFDLYFLAKNIIKSGEYQIERKGKSIPVNDIIALFSDKYEMDSKEYFISKLYTLLPEEIIGPLLQMEDEYIKKQVEKSDLNFLSLVK